MMKPNRAIRYLIFPVVLLFCHVSGYANILDAIRLAKKISQSELVATDFDSLTFPFHLVNNCIVVDVQIDNKGRSVPARFILDSGAPTVISDKLARENQFSQKEISGASDIINTPDGLKSAPEHLAQNLIFKMGAYQVKKGNTLVKHLDNDYSMVCNNIDGLLGVDFLCHAALVLDFEQQTLTLIKSKKFNPQSYGLKDYWTFSSYSLVQKTPYLDVQVNGQKEAAIIDLGYNGTVLMQFRNPRHKDAQQFLNAENKQTVETFGTLVTVNGPVAKQNYRYLQPSATLAQKELTIDSCLISFLINEKLKEDKINIGVGLLKSYLVAIDWQNKKLYLKQQKPSAEHNLPPRFSVAYFPAAKMFRVSVIGTDSRWYSKGLHAGDTVVSINGKLLSNLISENDGDACVIRTALSNLNEDIKNIVLTNGKQERTVSVE